MKKFSISFDDELYAEVRALADGNVSAWLAETAERRVRSEALVALLDEIADETGGPFTPEELEEGRRWLASSWTPEP